MSLTKEQIQAANDRPREFVPIKEWTPAGETFDPAIHGVWVGTLSAQERDRWEHDCLTNNGQPFTPNDNRLYDNAHAKLVVRCCENEDGSRFFTDEDVAMLGQKGSVAVTRLFEVAMRLSKLSSSSSDHKSQPAQVSQSSQPEVTATPGTTAA